LVKIFFEYIYVLYIRIKYFVRSLFVRPPLRNWAPFMRTLDAQGLRIYVRSRSVCDPSNRLFAFVLAAQLKIHAIAVVLHFGRRVFIQVRMYLIKSLYLIKRLWQIYASNYYH